MFRLRMLELLGLLLARSAPLVGYDPPGTELGCARARRILREHTCTRKPGLFLSLSLSPLSPSLSPSLSLSLSLSLPLSLSSIASPPTPPHCSPRWKRPPGSGRQQGVFAPESAREEALLVLLLAEAGLVARGDDATPERRRRTKVRVCGVS